MVQSTSLATAARYEEDTPAASGDKGALVLAVRNDAGGTLVDASGDYTPLTTDNLGNLRVVAVAAPGGVFNVDIVNFVNATFDHGSNSAIGLVATQFIAASTPATLGVEVKAANSNTANVYVGNSDVTAATVDATDGFELGPGESILIRVDNVNKIYAITTAAPQRVFWLVL